MYHADNEKWEKRISGRKRITNSRIHSDASREVKAQVLGNTGKGLHQISKDEKNKDSTLEEREKWSEPIYAVEISSKG